MERPSFLDRQTLGLPHYLLLGIVAALFVAFIPRGARMALQTNTNRVEDWLPAGYSESADLAWFRQQFGAQAFVLASWEGCTLGSPEQLEQLAQRLDREPLPAEIAQAANVAPHRDRRLFSRVLTGPRMIAELGEEPAKIGPSAAIERLEGALIGPPLVEGDDASRTTCLVAYMSPEAVVNNRTMRMAIERLQQIAVDEIGIARAELHMGGPPVDNVAIDIEGERSLRTLAGLSGLVGLVLAYLSFRSWKLTGMVLFVAVTSAGASLALVFYYGAIEVLALGHATAQLGRLDAILMSMPAVVYVLALSGAIHLVNYYRDACQSGGHDGAVERAVRMAAMPCGVAALTTAVGLASLATSHIRPIEKFGVFSAVGILAALGLLFLLLPAMLHRFAGVATSVGGTSAGGNTSPSTSLPRWAQTMVAGICRRSGLVTGGFTALMLLFGLGLPRIESSVQLLKLLDEEAELVQDYAWLEQHLGNLVPMEIILTVPGELQRTVDELPERKAGYAMTTYERLLMARRVGEQIETLPPVSRVLNAATFSPAEESVSQSASNRRTRDWVMSEAIDANRDALREYLRWGNPPPAQQQAPSTASQANEAAPPELWRASARIAALQDIDYGQFVGDLRGVVEPVLDAYRDRNELVAELYRRSQHLIGGHILVVVGETPSESDLLFVELLKEAGVGLSVEGRRGQLSAMRIDQLAPQVEQLREQLAQQTAIVVRDRQVAQQLAQLQLNSTALVDLAPLSPEAITAAATEDWSRHPSQQTAAASLEAVYTGVVPLVYKTQRELINSLQKSLVLATGLIALVMIALFSNIAAGVVAMIPNLFPIVLIFGALGWLGIKVDIGIMMTASVALGVAVDDTIHFISWFRRGLARGMARHDAVVEAYHRCATAMVQTTLIAGFGLAVFAVSTFTPTQQFGYLMITILAAALAGDLILLPALLIGPLGKLFEAGVVATAPATETITITDHVPQGDVTPDAIALDKAAHKQAPTPIEPPVTITPIRLLTEESQEEGEQSNTEWGRSSEAGPDHSDMAFSEPPPTEIAPPTSTATERVSLQLPPVDVPPAAERPRPVAIDQGNELSPAHAALREKLRALRRSSSREE